MADGRTKLCIFEHVSSSLMTGPLRPNVHISERFHDQRKAWSTSEHF